MKINLTKPGIDEKEINAATEVLKSGWLIRGKHAQALEEEFAKYMGAKYAVATNGCTMGLYLVLKKMNLQPDDEVIVPSLTWSATAAVVIHAGGKPVFADVKADDWCLDPEDVKKKITSKTRMIIPVHYAGRFAQGFENFDVPVMYDSAHRVEAGDFKGKVSCYSFYAVKNMTTIRGGMILTDSEEDYKWYLMAVHGGLSKDTLSRYKGQQKEQDASGFYYEVEVPLWNFDMTDVEAAIGREQLKKLPAANNSRDSVVVKYNQAFGLSNTGNHLYPILVANRDEFLVNMKNAGIHCGVHYLPLHLMRGYKDYKASLPVTEQIGSHCVSLPLYADMTGEEISYVIEQTLKYAEFLKD
jgi:dTDP-4-amino-4,6-dideoxygalactose transaminase